MPRNRRYTIYNIYKNVYCDCSNNILITRILYNAQYFRPIAPGAGALRYECFRISTTRLRKGSRYGRRKVWVAALEILYKSNMPHNRRYTICNIYKIAYCYRNNNISITRILYIAQYSPKDHRVIHTYTHTYTYTYIYIYICLHIHTYLHEHIYIKRQIYKYTWLQFTTLVSF